MWNNLVRFARKSTEKTTERREKRAQIQKRAVSLFVLFHSSAFVCSSFFASSLLLCVNALLFSPTRNKRREVEEREVCFENNNTHTHTQRERERERERESASAFLVGALSPRSALFELFLPSSCLVCFPHKQIGFDTTER